MSLEMKFFKIVSFSLLVCIKSSSTTEVLPKDLIPESLIGQEDVGQLLPPWSLGLVTSFLNSVTRDYQRNLSVFETFISIANTRQELKDPEIIRSSMITALPHLVGENDNIVPISRISLWIKQLPQIIKFNREEIAMRVFTKTVNCRMNQVMIWRFNYIHHSGQPSQRDDSRLTDLSSQLSQKRKRKTVWFQDDEIRGKCIILNTFLKIDFPTNDQVYQELLRDDCIFPKWRIYFQQINETRYLDSRAVEVFKRIMIHNNNSSNDIVTDEIKTEFLNKLIGRIREIFQEYDLQEIYNFIKDSTNPNDILILPFEEFTKQVLFKFKNLDCSTIQT